MIIESKPDFQRICCSEGKNYNHEGEKKEMGEKDWDTHIYATLTCQIRGRMSKLPL